MTNTNANCENHDPQLKTCKKLCLIMISQLTMVIRLDNIDSPYSMGIYNGFTT